MARLTVDASATLINRTAVNFLIRDTVGALGDSIGGFQFFGERIGNFNVGEVERKHLQSRFYSTIEAGQIPRQNDNGAKRDPILYFDPLYALFGDLGEQDFVFVLDMTTITNPEWHSENVSRLYRAAFERILRTGCSTIHISRHTMLSMRATLGSEGRNPNILHLYNRSLLKESDTSSYYPFVLDDYFLFVGSLEIRKNLAGLISAYAMTNLAERGIRLVIVGGDGHGAAEIREVAEQTEGALLLGYVPDGDLFRLYQGACAFVYPSFLEGFGLPLLEAMSHGIPCMASITGASPEVGGPEMAYVDPYDIPALSEVLMEMAQKSEEDHLRDGQRLKNRAITLFGFENYMQNLRRLLALGN